MTPFIHALHIGTLAAWLTVFGYWLRRRAVRRRREAQAAEEAAAEAAAAPAEESSLASNEPSARG